MSLLKVAFWGSLGALAWTHVGYPLAAAAAARARTRPVRRDPDATPSVTVSPGTPASLGSGIAVAFVATVYGVGVANLVLLPIAGRLRERAADAARRGEIITQGLDAILRRLHPHIVARKLQVFSTTTQDVEEIARRMPRVAMGSGRPS